jgi:hypothetical protein
MRKLKLLVLLVAFHIAIALCSEVACWSHTQSASHTLNSRPPRQNTPIPLQPLPPLHATPPHSTPLHSNPSLLHSFTPSLHSTPLHITCSSTARNRSTNDMPLNVTTSLSRFISETVTPALLWPAKAPAGSWCAFGGACVHACVCVCVLEVRVCIRTWFGLSVGYPFSQQPNERTQANSEALDRKKISAARVESMSQLPHHGGVYTRLSTLDVVEEGHHLQPEW